MARRRLALLLCMMMASVALAGCADDPGSDGDDPGPTATPTTSPDQPNPGGSRALVAGARPVWYEGLQWTYDVDSPEVGLAAPLTLVVLGEDDTNDAWQVAPTNASDRGAVMWSLFWHLPPIGTVSKTDLSPHIHGQSVAWFDWPLQDGKAWQAPDHHGTPVNYTATLAETTLFDGRSVAAFEVVGERGGATWLRYVYTAEVAWFTEAEVDGDGDGVVDHRVTLSDVRPGSAHLSTPTFEAIELATVSDAGPQSLVEPATSFTVPDDASEVYAFFVLGGGPGRYTGSITLPSGNVKSFNFTNTNQTPMAVVRGGAYDATPGDGNVGSVIVGDGFVFAEIFAVKRADP